MTGKMKPIPILVLLACGLFWTSVDPLAAQVEWDRQHLKEELDSLVRAHVENPMVPGVSAAVVLAGDTLLFTGEGWADVEFDVPLPADASFEIGSVTKQFTAASILQLVERGEIDLNADVRDYLPDFDTGVYQVPVFRLLDHTSGIKGYTEMPVFGEIVRDPLPRDTLVSLVELEPFDFEPGYALIYNNSAYFLLGLMIEKVTGQDYATYIEENLFEPAGMDDSYYCDSRQVVKGRAHGYDALGEGQLGRAGYLDHRWPYAAGSLCSTVGDLVAWNQALHGGHLLSPESYEALITPVPLEDGTPIRYAKGLAVHELRGHKVISHGGGINGFLSAASYHPEADLIVIVLQNSTGASPEELAMALVERVLAPAESPAAGSFTGDLGALTGTYNGPARGQALTVEVRADNDELVLDFSDREVRPSWEEGLTWREGSRLFMFREIEGSIEELRIDQISGHYVLGRVVQR